MIYIDFDGVILDTEDLMFEEWRKNPNRHSLSETDKIEYLKKVDWKCVLKKSKIINNSIKCLELMDIIVVVYQSDSRGSFGRILNSSLIRYLSSYQL